MVQLTTIRPSSARSELDCSPLPAADRFDAWTDALSRSFVPLSALADREARGHFDGRLVSQEFGSTQMAAVAGSAVTVSRSDADIASADPGRGRPEGGRSTQGDQPLRPHDRAPGSASTWALLPPSATRLPTMIPSGHSIL